MSISTEQFTDAELLNLCELADRIHRAKGPRTPVEHQFLATMRRLELWSPK